MENARNFDARSEVRFLIIKVSSLCLGIFNEGETLVGHTHIT